LARAQGATGQHERLAALKELRFDVLHAEAERGVGATPCKLAITHIVKGHKAELHATFGQAPNPCGAHPRALKVRHDKVTKLIIAEHAHKAAADTELGDPACNVAGGAPTVHLKAVDVAQSACAFGEKINKSLTDYDDVCAL
jgi:hypothetical protein